ncbi:tetratricopeptide repeat protein [Cellulomonas sp. NPDC089187]|uniref:tetratricopeptide repeat protein n=1 Tax=Cellulomonas sp. NPDC089187 TaxID=3154970 RepID=UPI00341B04A8
MTENPTGGPRLNMRGAVDLSSLARPATPPPGTPGGLPTPGAWVVDVDTEGFPALVQSSTGYPVIVLLWASWSEASVKLAADLGSLVGQYNGRLQLARIDADANPQVAAAFQSQSVPTVVAVLAGQPLPLFQGAPELDQIKGVLDQVLEAAAANGITGTVPGAPSEPAAAEPEPDEPPLPPLHQAAYDAIERDDFGAAAAAYEQALKENPRDDMARAGLAQVGLLSRTRDADLSAARTAAAQAPQDPDAQMAVADLDVLGGQVEDAFARLIDTIRVTFGPDRERLRVRLVELFDVVGAEDPRVQQARRALASALY